MIVFQNAAGSGSRYHVDGCAVGCGSDWAVTICGGTLHHIGAVSLAAYEPVRDSATVSTITCYTHRDDRLSMELAKSLSRRLKCTVTVSVGLHIDEAGADEINRLWENAVECAEALCADIRRHMEGDCHGTGDSRQ